MDSHLHRPSSPPSRDPAALASTFLERGVEAFERNERAMAWGWLHKALAISMSSNDQKGLAAAGWRLSLLKAQQGELEEALKLCRTAYQAAESVWSRVDMAESAYLLGTLLCQANEQEEGLRLLHASVDLCGELHDVEGQLRAWRNIGGILRKRGSYFEAIEAWKRCLVVYGQRGELAEQARLHAVIARSWMRIGDTAQTVTHALAALGRHRHLGSDRLESDLKLLSRLRRRMGTEALSASIGGILDAEGLGVVMAMLDDYDARQARIQRAAALAEATSDLSEADGALLGVPAPAEPSGSSDVPAEGDTQPSITLSSPADVLADSDSLSTWEDNFWETDRTLRLPQQPWQIWVLAGFGTIIGMMTVMVILSVGAMILR